MNKHDFGILYSVWKELYPNYEIKALDAFCEELMEMKKNISLIPLEKIWYKKVVVYSLYVDKFADNFSSLIIKLNYLQNLGINCLWLLPILDSPMRDEGFDIRNYKKLRNSLFGLDENASDVLCNNLFKEFIKEAHKRGIYIVFDIALNHCSDEHQWFVNARSSRDNPYRDYFIWSDEGKEYSDARVIFKGMCDSNWTKTNDQYYFHRFFEFQPDLNYKNPKVLLEMIYILIYWLKFGIDGFRADAIPYLWKEENTNCENLRGTHLIIKFIYHVINYIRPNVLFLAEACQKPMELVKYIGDADECNGGYHFPLMAMIFKAIATHNGDPIKHILNYKVTPKICSNSQWFIFLRCHDELSLEDVYVSEEDRKIIFNAYCYESLWNFRQGEGIASRLSNLMNYDENKILLAFSIILTLPGTPVIYYGDEVGMSNDEKYYNSKIQSTGKNDTRFLVRGKIDWSWLNLQISNKETFNSKVYHGFKKMIDFRNKINVFGQGDIEWINSYQEGVLAYYRSDNDHKVLVINNLTGQDQSIKIPDRGDLLLKRYGYRWIWIN